MTDRRTSAPGADEPLLSFDRLRAYYKTASPEVQPIPADVAAEAA